MMHLDACRHLTIFFWELIEFRCPKNIFAVTLSGLRDAVSAEAYKTACLALIGKYKLLRPIVQEDMVSLDDFMHKYGLVAPAARHRCHSIRKKNKEKRKSKEEEEIKRKEGRKEGKERRNRSKR